MLNFLMRKEFRKILKRKDSDAGDTGKALEDLQSSLFNGFRSSEGAKHQQQHIWRPIIALSFNFFVAVGIIFMNKLVSNAVVLYSVKTDTSKLAIDGHAKNFCCPSCISIIKVDPVILIDHSWLCNVPRNWPGKRQPKIQLMSKIAVTPSIVLAEYIIYHKKVSFSKVLALTVVMIGVAVATVTDLEFNLLGACVAVVWIIPSAVNKILWSSMQQQENWAALALMWKTTPITVLFLVAMIPWLDPPGVLGFNWNLHCAMAIFMSAILGFLLQWSGALALGATSALSHVVLGQFKTCVVLLGNYYLFNSNPGRNSVCGAFAAIAGMTVYTYLNLKQQTSRILPRQASTLTKSKMSKENGDPHDKTCGGGESV